MASVMSQPRQKNDTRNVIASTRSAASDFPVAAAKPPAMIGPQVGRGKLTGRVYGTTIGLGLNPDMVDNNVFLAGTIVGGRITGVWEYAGFPGVLNRGTFAAALKR